VELAGVAAAGRGRKGRNLQKGEGGEEREETNTVDSLPLDNRSRRRKSTAGRRRTSQWLPLSPVRIWVRGEAEKPSVGGRERFLGSLTAEDAMERKKDIKTKRKWQKPGRG